MAEGRWGEMTAIFEKLAFYWTYPFVRYALIVGVLIALCSSLLGVTLVLKRFSFIGDGLSHVAFGAMSIAAAQDTDAKADEVRELAQTKYGSTIIYPDDAQLDTFRPAAEQYIKDWVAKYGTETFDAQDYVDKAMELAEKYAD